MIATILPFILSFISIFTLLVLIFIIANWFLHLSMMNDDKCMIYGWGTYKKFKREFEKYEYEYDENFKRSLFSYNRGDAYLHANIIKFKDIGMKICDPISYLFVVIIIYKHCNKLNKLNKKEVKLYKW